MQGISWFKAILLYQVIEVRLLNWSLLCLSYDLNNSSLLFFRVLHINTSLSEISDKKGKDEKNETWGQLTWGQLTWGRMGQKKRQERRKEKMRQDETTQDETIRVK